MHETTQRRICRAVFLALCVLPTLALAGWVGWRLCPGRHDAVLASLGRQLGCRVTINRIATPRPGVWRLFGGVLADPETGAPLASFDRLEFQHQAGRVVGQGGELRIGQPLAASRVVGRLVRQDHPGAARLRWRSLTLGSAELKLEQAEVRLSGLDGEQAAGRRLEILAGGETRVRVDRLTDQPARPATRLLVDTGRQAAPWAWVAAAMAPASTAGDAEPPAGRFRGRLEAFLSDGPTHAEATGVLSGFRPEAVLGRDCGLALADAAVVRIESLRVVDGRVDELEAAVEAGAGEASYPLLVAANQFLQCAATRALHDRLPTAGDPARWPPIAFDSLAFRVSLNEQGVAVDGGGVDRVVLASAGRPLMLAPASGRAPVGALLHLVAPNAKHFHPATPEALALANRLPREKRPL